MPREYRSLTPEERAQIADGNRLNRARRLRAEHPGLTPEQLILCVAPECSDADVGRLADRLAAPRPDPPAPRPDCGPKENPRDFVGSPRGRRVVRKGHEMS